MNPKVWVRGRLQTLDLIRRAVLVIWRGRRAGGAAILVIAAGRKMEHGIEVRVDGLQSCEECFAAINQAAYQWAAPYMLGQQQR